MSNLNDKFGPMHQSLIKCEWCQTQLEDVRAHKVFTDGPKGSEKYVKYVGWCPKCKGELWSNDITPAQSQEAFKANLQCKTP